MTPSDPDVGKIRGGEDGVPWTEGIGRAEDLR